MDSTDSPDPADRLNVTVIGAGIVGISTAEHLRRDGHQVTLVDRAPPGDPQQTSYGNAGLLTPSSMVPVPVPGLPARLPKMLLSRNSPLFLRWRHLPRLAPWLIRFLAHARPEIMERTAAVLAPLLADAPQEHLELARGTGAEKFLRMSEIAYLYPDRRALDSDRALRELRRDHGCPSEVLDREELTRLDPELAGNYQHGALFRNHGYLTSPGGYVAALAAHFASNGGVVRIAEARDLTRLEDGRLNIATSKGTLIADRVVICTGIDSGHWMGRLGHRAQLESERGYHLMLHGARPLPPIPYLLADGKAALTPMEDGLRVAGLVEFASRNAPPSRRPLVYLRHLVRRVYPEIRWESEESWMGHRPATVDSLPVLGASPHEPGVVFAFGTQHVGITCGPRLGRWAAGLAAGRPMNTDFTPYRVDRFG